MSDKLNNQLDKSRHAKNDMLFSFQELADEKGAAKALEKIVKIFTRAGNGVIPDDSKAEAAEISKIKRTAGVKYREIAINFLDSQSLVLRVKETGDIFQVVLNKKVVPIKNQDDQKKAITELVGMLNAGRSKFQAAMAKVKVKLPSEATTAKPKQVEVLTATRDKLKEDIATIREEMVKLGAGDSAGK